MTFVFNTRKNVRICRKKKGHDRLLARSSCGHSASSSNETDCLDAANAKVASYTRLSSVGRSVYRRAIWTFYRRRSLINGLQSEAIETIYDFFELMCCMWRIKIKIKVIKKKYATKKVSERTWKGSFRRSQWQTHFDLVARFSGELFVPLISSPHCARSSYQGARASDVRKMRH